MTQSEAVTDGRWSLEKFAQNTFYREINRRLVALASLRPGMKVVDLGAGTGAVTRLIAQHVSGPGAEVIALEPSRTALEVTKQNLADAKDVVLDFIRGSAENLSQLVKRRRPVDAIFFCNAIHLVQEKGTVVREVYRSLRDGGTFSFNTSFFQGAEPPESMQFYRRWMMKALRYLREEYNLAPDKAQRALARQQLTPEEYVDLLEANGFRVREKEVVPVPITLNGFRGISEYGLFIEGAMPGVPLEPASEALKHAVGETFKELGLDASPRNWLLVVAEK